MSANQRPERSEAIDLAVTRFFMRQRREIMARIEEHEVRRRTRRWAASAAAAAAVIAVAVLGFAGSSGPTSPAISTAWMDAPILIEEEVVADPLAAFGPWPVDAAGDELAQDDGLPMLEGLLS